MHPDNKWVWLEKIAIAFLVVAVACDCIVIIKFPFRGYDTYSHIFWIAEWHKLWQAGIFYPRWLPGSFAGFGAPSFYFYPPLSFFLSSALYAILPMLSAEAIGKLLGILAFAGSGFSIWLYLRWRIRSHIGSTRSMIPVLGSLLYVCAPYHFFDYSVRGAISEHLALLFVPVFFWGFDLISERGTSHNSRKGNALVTLSLVLLILSNLPATAVAGVGALFYVLAARTLKFRLFATLVGCAIMAALLTAFYLLPIAALFSDVQFNRLWLPASVVLSSPFLAIFSGKMLTINSYSMLSLIGACILLIGSWRNNRLKTELNHYSQFYWILLVIVFLQLPYVSWFLFNFVPPFTVIQLASRLSVLVLFIAVVVWTDELSEQHKVLAPRERNSIRFASLLVLVWSVGGIGLVSLQLANVHVHNDATLPLGEAPEYAPKWSRPYYDFGASLSAPFPNGYVWAVWQGNPQPTHMQYPKQRAPYTDTVEYVSALPGHILFRRSYWPGWHAMLDGKPVPTASDSLGRLIVAAPAGGWHRITTSLDLEPSAKLGAWISAGAVVVAGIVWMLL